MKQGHALHQTRRIVPWWPAPLGANYAFEYVVDAGIVELLPGVKAQPSIIDIAGKHPFVALPPSLDLKVVRRGFRTQVKTGKVEAVGCTLVWPNNHAGKRFKAGVGGTLFAIRSDPGEATAMPGDSGSLVVDSVGQATRGLVCLTDGLDGGVTWACDILDVMNAIEIDTACNGGINLLVSAAVMKELVSSIAERERLVDEHIRKFARFRADYLSSNSDGGLSSALGALLEEESGQTIAEALLTDDDFVGLLNRAIGAWLVQPTVFEMLEYRLGRGRHLGAHPRPQHLRIGRQRGPIIHRGRGPARLRRSVLALSITGVRDAVPSRSRPNGRASHGGAAN